MYIQGMGTAPCVSYTHDPWDPYTSNETLKTILFHRTLNIHHDIMGPSSFLQRLVLVMTLARSHSMPTQSLYYIKVDRYMLDKKWETLADNDNAII